jgi:quinol monooxygenase YgiN
MLIVHVDVRVKSDCIEAFKEATLDNARQSVKDVIQHKNDPTRFVLVEVYRSEEATVAHKETAHYATWRERAGPLMAEARTRVQYTSVFPADDGW